MEFRGHVGAALAAYAPIAFVTLRLGATRLALAGAVVTVALASLPDVDLYGTRLTHRGYLHTVWFAGVVGVGCALAFGAVGDRLVARPAVGVDDASVPAFGFLVGAVATLAHLTVDALTPMGVAPLAPLRRQRYSLGLTRSADPDANRRLLLLGLVTVSAAAVLGRAAAPSVG